VIAFIAAIASAAADEAGQAELAAELHSIPGPCTAGVAIRGKL
jgi:hypothetical protein